MDTSNNTNRDYEFTIKNSAYTTLVYTDSSKNYNIRAIRGGGWVETSPISCPERRSFHKIRQSCCDATQLETGGGVVLYIPIYQLLPPSGRRDLQLYLPYGYI